MYCPKCKKSVAIEKHEYPGKTEYICSECGFRIKVVYRGYVRHKWGKQHQFTCGTAIWNIEKQRWETIPVRPFGSVRYL